MRPVVHASHVWSGEVGPHQPDGTALAHCYGRGRVLARSDDADGIRLEVELAPRLLGPVEAYRQPA